MWHLLKLESSIAGQSESTAAEKRFFHFYAPPVNSGPACHSFLWQRMRKRKLADGFTRQE